LEVIKDRQLDYLGTKLDAQEKDYIITDCNGIQIGLMCYTYETGTSDPETVALNGITLTKADSKLVNAFSYSELDKFYAEIEENIAQMEEDYLDTMLELDPDIIDVLETLSRHYRLAMLSNDIGSWSKHLRQHHGLDEYFEEAIISGDVMVRKPDPRIYEIAAQRLGLEPQECVFVDDRPGNLEPAAELGMRTVLYNRDGHDYDGEQILSLAELPDLL
jgi:HAD superfamily hydrolase (TIGR01509 family)